MPSYIYKAKKDATNTMTGRSPPRTRKTPGNDHQLGLVPVSIERATPGRVIQPYSRGQDPFRELYLFTKQLANLLKSGVTC